MITSNSIRVFIVGGVTGESNESNERMLDSARRLGIQLGQTSSIKLVVCSPHPNSADAAVITGFASSPANKQDRVIIHHPLDDRSKLKAGDSIADRWKALIAQVGLIKPQIRQNSQARVIDESGFSNAFLLCQIKALKEDTDVVVALGGRKEASAAQLLAIARGSYPIVPFAFLGGAAEQEFLRQEASNRSTFGQQNLADALQQSDGIDRILELVEKSHRAIGRYHIFMSYSWNRKEEADYVEAFLRRYSSITLFRDEEEIQTSEPISGSINDQLQKCAVFLVLWCSEYVASPNCYDELMIATKRKDCQIYILKLDDTRPVWPILRQPQSHEWKDKWMPPGEGDEKRGAIAASLNELLRLLRESPQ